MALTDKLKSIADGFRASRGISDELSLTQMAALAAVPLGIEEQLIAGAYPDYVREELARVASEARKVITAESIVSICLSDSHYYDSENTRLAGLHAAMAIKGLTYLLPVDFIAHLGDVGNESSQTDTANLEQNILEMLGFVKEAAGKEIPIFAAIGNHDNGNYITSTDSTDMVDPAFLYQHFTALSDSDNTVISGEDVGGYCYRDFPSKKLRVFLLNTGEGLVTGGASNDTGASETQRAWFAAALQELNSKADAAEWMFMVLCHYPADYGAARPLSNLLAAYVNGTSITLNGTAYSFSGCNGAKFLVQHHGHIHNFLADRLYYGSTPVQYDAWRVGIPNTQYDRENYYGEFSGVNYGEAKSYTKAPNTAKDTSFVVNVTNPSEEKIYSFYYGAGTNRVISIGDAIYYGITKDLTNVTISNDAVSVAEGQPYTANVIASTGYDMQTLKITMGGKDVTADVYADGVITIDSVTGNIVIVAKAQARPNFTNLVPLSVNTDGTDFNVDGDGYDNGTCIQTGGMIGELANYTTTGFIPVSAGTKTIRIAGDGLSTDSEYTRIAFFDSNFALVGSVYALKKLGSSIYYGVVTEEEATLLTWTVDTTNMPNPAKAPYIRVGTKGDGANLIVTVNEEISYGGSEIKSYTVTNNLTNATNSNSATSVDVGGSYASTISPNDGYELSAVTVNMGGVDVTDNVYANGSINIGAVTGNIIITASATALQPTGYTNWIPLSTSAYDSTEIYNGVGYKTGTRVNSSYKEASAANMCCTGFIPVAEGQTIRIKNVTVAGGSSAYLLFYSSTGSNGNSYQQSDMTSAMDSNGVITLAAKITGNGYMRLSVGVIDDTSIITLDEEITD